MQIILELQQEEQMQWYIIQLEDNFPSLRLKGMSIPQSMW